MSLSRVHTRPEYKPSQKTLSVTGSSSRGWDEGWLYGDHCKSLNNEKLEFYSENVPKWVICPHGWQKRKKGEARQTSLPPSAFRGFSVSSSSPFHCHSPPWAPSSLPGRLPQRAVGKAGVGWRLGGRRVSEHPSKKQGSRRYSVPLRTCFWLSWGNNGDYSSYALVYENSMKRPSQVSLKSGWYSC